MCGIELSGGCTCGPYMSVIPPGPCPVHTPIGPGWLRSAGNLTSVCIGRHCAHTTECAPYGWATNG